MTAWAACWKSGAWIGRPNALGSPMAGTATTPWRPGVCRASLKARRGLERILIGRLKSVDNSDSDAATRHRPVIGITGVMTHWIGRGAVVLLTCSCAPSEPDTADDPAATRPRRGKQEKRFVRAPDSLVTAFEFSNAGCGDEEVERFADRHGRKPATVQVQQTPGQTTVSLSAYQSHCGEWAGDAVRRGDIIELSAVATSNECRTEGCIWRATWTLADSGPARYRLEGHDLNAE